jgi:hypothetical protein
MELRPLRDGPVVLARGRSFRGNRDVGAPSQAHHRHRGRHQDDGDQGDGQDDQSGRRRPSPGGRGWSEVDSCVGRRVHRLPLPPARPAAAPSGPATGRSTVHVNHRSQLFHRTHRGAAGPPRPPRGGDDLGHHHPGVGTGGPDRPRGRNGADSPRRPALVPKVRPVSHPPLHVRHRPRLRQPQPPVDIVIGVDDTGEGPDLAVRQPPRGEGVCRGRDGGAARAPPAACLVPSGRSCRSATPASRQPTICPSRYQPSRWSNSASIPSHGTRPPPPAYPSRPAPRPARPWTATAAPRPDH